MTIHPDHLAPADGTFIPLSKKKGRENVLFGSVLVIVGIAMMFFRWYTIGGGAIFVGAVFIVALGAPLLLGSGGLVISTDCLQEIEGRRKIIAHVPYKNIAEIRYVVHLPPFVGVNLIDVADADSYSKVRFGSLKDHNGFDYVLVDVYTIEPKELYEQLMRVYRAFIEHANSGLPMDDKI